MVSSGRTSFLLSALAQLSGQNEAVGLIDPANAFDPASAAAFGIHLGRLLWIRAGGPRFTIRQVLKTVDLLVQGGGFGLVGVDLSDLPPAEIRQVPSSPWFRLQRATENTPTILLFLNREPTLGTAAALSLKMEVAHTQWTARFLRELRPEVRIVRSKHGPASIDAVRPFRLFPADSIRAGLAGDIRVCARTAGDIHEL